jgi:hypothetical protein
MTVLDFLCAQFLCPLFVYFFLLVPLLVSIFVVGS